MSSLDSTAQGKSKGARTRGRILGRAVDIAAAEGLEGLTIGRLAADLGMSKSGLFAHFGSKEELQLEVVVRARRGFLKNVVEVAERAEPGLPRLYAMASSWIGHIEKSSRRGGCFFAAAAAEFDGRPGAVRDRLATLTKHWRDLLEGEAERAMALGHIRADTDAALLAFRLHAYPQEANWAMQLLGDARAAAQARTSSEELLRSVATPDGLRRTKQRRTVFASRISG